MYLIRTGDAKNYTEKGTTVPEPNIYNYKEKSTLITFAPDAINILHGATESHPPVKWVIYNIQPCNWVYFGLTKLPSGKYIIYTPTAGGFVNAYMVDLEPAEAGQYMNMIDITQKFTEACNRRNALQETIKDIAITSDLEYYTTQLNNVRAEIYTYNDALREYFADDFKSMKQGKPLNMVELFAYLLI